MAKVLPLEEIVNKLGKCSVHHWVLKLFRKLLSRGGECGVSVRVVKDLLQGV